MSTSTPTPTSTAPLTTAEVARFIIARERKMADQCIEAIRWELNIITSYQSSGGVRAHNLDAIISRARDAQRYLYRVEALEELKP